ncbi:hypothetical protein G4228_012693 [Cervus hanglu yarkandensis]|nr:hypothetical protein G4228_012693 [Cervus hanglu yarkandensis]
MVEKKTSVRSQDPGQRRVLDPAARQRRINRQLEALENDNFQDDPHAGLPHLGKRLPQFDDDADTGKKKKTQDEIMQQEIRPLVAVDIIEQLHRQFAILSGGRGKDGAPIITFPEFVGFKHIPDEDFLNVMTYLTSVPSMEAASIGFVIVIDRRRDKWSSIKASLTRIAVAFPGNLKLIFILRPSRFIQRTFTDIGIKYYRDEFKMKVPIVMLNSISDLHDYIDKSQLTEDLGGTLEYHHSQWINHRTAIESFALALKTTAQMLQTFGACLATTELPRSIPSTEDLLMSHMRQQNKLQVKLALNNLLAEQEEFSDIGDNVVHVEQLLKEHKKLEGEGQVSQWCEAGIYLLASQAVDKCQSREGVDIALNDIETFLGTAKEYQLPSSKDFYNQYELMLTLDIKNAEILESSHDAENPEPEQPDSSKNLSPSRHIIRDLLETEETYIKEIKNIIDGYIIPMDFIWLKHLIPDVLRNNKEFLFGNIREIYEFHNRTFLKELEKCTENPELLARCFLKRVCQRQLGHNLPLFTCLREPSQRLVKYQMLLKGLLDFESPEDLEMDPSDLEGGSAKNEPKRTKDSAFLADLQQALAMMEDLIKSCELAMDLAAVTGCPDDIGKLGKLLMHDSFNVWTVHKDRYKMKDLIRFKPSQRQIYLFEQGIVFCKIQMEPSDQGLCPHYSFKKSVKLMTLSIRQLGRGSNRKFEIANQNGLEKYILQLSGLFRLDDSYDETSKSGQQQGESIRGEKEGCQEEDTAMNETEESLGMSTGLLVPAGEASFPRAEALRAQEGSLRPPSAEN